MSLKMRDATMDDAPAIAAIYKDYVETSVATFEEVPPDAGEIADRIRQTQDAGFPWLVMEEDGRAVGYAYAGPFHKRAGYRFTVENSIYVAPSHARRGIGAALTREVIARCTKLGYRQMIAVITADFEGPSVKMHQALGFKPVGFTPSVGMKFGRWLDIIYLQLALGEGDRSIPQ